MTDKNASALAQEEEVKLLRCRRAGYKGKITSTIKLAQDNLDPDNISNCSKLIESYLDKVQELDCQINSIICEDDSEDEIEDSVVNEIDKQSAYTLRIKSQLTEYVTACQSVERKGGYAKVTAGVDVVNAGGSLVRLPQLQCDTFNGEGSNQLEFHTFITQFKNIIDSRNNVSDSIKFTYLRSYLKGYASKIVQHLMVNDENYKVALDLLNNEFMNENELVENLFIKLLALKPKYDTDYLGTKMFINDVRCLISDLGKHKVDLIGDVSANKLISHMVFHKLPNHFQQELVRMLANYYPSIDQIFDNYVDVIRTLSLRHVKSTADTKPQFSKHANKTFYNDKVPFNKFSNNTISRSGTVKNAVFEKSPSSFSKNTDKNESAKFCKFCTSIGHTMFKCVKYQTLSERKARCDDLNMCTNCTSQKHASDKCTSALDFKCIYCGSNKHISAMCAKIDEKISTYFCLNSATDSGETFLLPFIRIKVHFGDHSTFVNCLVDTGSQRSYVSSDVLKQLNLKPNKKHDFTVSTFINSTEKSFSNQSLSLDFGNHRKNFVIPFLVDDDLDISFKIDGLTEAYGNISKKHRLNSMVENDHVKLDGLLGVDALQCFKSFSMVPCLGGVAFQLLDSIIPFGNIDNFLSVPQLESKYSKNCVTIQPEVPNNVEPQVQVNKSIVNFVLNPSKTFFDPIGSVLTDSQVDDRLDKMFSVESLGIVEKMSDYDTEQIEKFNSGVTFENGKYNVVLPWKESISDVQSNFHVCKNILDRVCCDLKNKDLYENYDKVLQEQVSTGIIEKVEFNENDNIFIPHRPVIKVDEQCTTKLRIVLNCSLKTKKGPSLNESAYHGVDLLNNLTELLIKFRFGTYFMMSDLRRAFLQIMLSEESDRKKFHILWYDSNGKLIAYRYRTIVFGFSSSPFILHQVIKLHLQKYPYDLCSKVLDKNMYVDNLLVSGNDRNELLNIYQQSNVRMQEGGFDLLSWSSNDKNLTERFQNDERACVHNSPFEKVLGYNYCPSSDQISIAKFDTKITGTTITKRIVLSYTASIFDPVGFASPISVRSKFIMNELWKRKLEWDDPVPTDILVEWEKLKCDLDELPKLKFDRHAYDEKIQLIFFCDASKKAYGFSCYARSENNDAVKSQLIFSKAKVAPNKHKLPTLELLSAFLAIKCMSLILSALEGKVSEIIVCLDAQVALS